jgi:hypothetical protein
MSPRSLSAVRALAVLALLTLGLPSVAHAQATCTGLCSQQVACTTGSTTISGTVYAPNGTDPLPNVLVYIPNAPVLPFPNNVECNPNGEPASGLPLVSTTTAVNGTFTLTNVPVGSNIPLVIQAGKWRRQFVIPTVSSCVNTPASNASGTGTDNTSVPVGHNIHLPQNQGEGDIPKIAIATGAVDAVECVLSKMGVATSEFTNPGGSGRINFYLGLDGAGAQIAGGGTPNEVQLENNLSNLEQYDLVMLPCQGLAYSPTASYLANVAQYANVGGRIYATHYSYDFLTYPSTTDPAGPDDPATSPFQGVANWDVAQTTSIPTDTATINTSFPDGSLLANWLQVVGASTTLGQIPVNTIRQDQDGIVAPTQSYLSISNPPESIQFTFSTPVGAPPATQCGRVLYNEYHVENGSFGGSTFPAECTSGAITAQERFLEYSLFDLGTFSTPPAVPTVSVSVTGNPTTLTQGDTADTALVTITNTGSTATNTTLSLALTLPSGLTATALTPVSPTSGWTCNVNTLTCTRGTGLDAGAPDNVDNVSLTYSVSNTATSPQTLSATVSNGNLASPATGTAQFAVLLVPTINWPTPAPITYGTPLSSTQLDALASYNNVTVQGTYAYTPPAGTYLTPASGPQTLSVTFTPDASGTYASATQIVGLQVNPATPSILIFAPGSITYGTPSIGLSASLSYPGPAAPTGAVTFLIDSTISVPATCTSSGSCTATYNSTALSAGPHNLSASIAADTNYAAATSSTVQLYVSQATPSLTPPVASAITYGTGSVLFHNSISYSGSVAPTGNLFISIDGGPLVPGTCQPAVAGTLNCITQFFSPAYTLLAAGSHSVVASIVAQDNYTAASSAPGTLTVNPAPVNVSIIGNPSKPYDGTTAATLTSANYQFNGLFLADAITVTQPNGNYAAATAGPETVTASLTASNFAATTGSLNNYILPTFASGPGTINQAPTVTTVTCSPGSVTYNGQPQTPCTAAVTGPGGLSQPVTPVSYTSNVNAGVNTASASATFTGDTNHTGSTGSATFTILQAPLTVTAGYYYGQYDGGTHSLFGCITSTNVDGISCTNSISSVGPDVGSGVVTPVVQGLTGNYSVTSNTGSWNITVRPVVLTAGNLNGTYTGSTQTPSPCTSSYGGVTCANSPASVGPGAGSGSVTPVSSLVTGNAADYSFYPTNGTWTIAPAATVTTITCPTSVVYNGSAQAPCSATVTGPGPFSQSVPVVYSANTNFGPASVGATFAGDTNHTGSTNSTTFQITPLSVTVTAGSYSGVYDGNAHPLSACTSTYAGVTCANSPASVGPGAGSGVTNPVPSYPAGNAADYAVTKLTGTYNIIKATPVITWATPAPIVYGTLLSSTQLDAVASVPGSTYNYTPAAGSEPAVGTDTLSVTFTPSDAVDYTTAMGSTTLTVTPSGLRYVAVTPCRIADTRNANGPFGGPIVPANGMRTLLIPNSSCGIPATAQAYALNVTVVPPSATDLYYLQVAPTGTPQPPTSLINSNDGRIRSVSTIIGAGASGGVDFYATQATQVVVDIDGYYTSAPTALEYYAVAPCRAVDTRTVVAGGPVPLTPMATENFVLAGKCNIPSTAQAYSVNVTGVPLQTKINQLTVWATGTAQPATPLLTSPTGIPVANGTIVKAGTNGSVSILSTDPASVVIDVNGYYAPPATGGLSLYPVTPCRALDTRKSGGGGPFTGTKVISIPSLGCSVPTTAKAFVLNATVQPVTVLDYLTLYPNQPTVPNVSILDAVDGFITPNLAVVSTTNGSIDAYAPNTTQLVLDVTGYFAP